MRLIRKEKGLNEIGFMNTYLIVTTSYVLDITFPCAFAIRKRYKP